MSSDETRTVADYCRRIESYLCQKNGGHLVRVVGPAFEEVRGWARQGIPMKIVFRAIDQCCERHAARGQRRRPVRIEFCAADVLALLDEWRRAVGIGDAGEPGGKVRTPSLASHVERVVARLIALRSMEGAAPLPGTTIDAAVQALDRISESSRKARGADREGLIAELASIDRALLELVAGSLDKAVADSLHREAEEELVVFGERMPPEARAAAVNAAYMRLVREWARLPRIAFD